MIGKRLEYRLRRKRILVLILWMLLILFIRFAKVILKKVTVNHRKF